MSGAGLVQDPPLSVRHHLPHSTPHAPCRRHPPRHPRAFRPKPAPHAACGPARVLLYHACPRYPLSPPCVSPPRAPTPRPPPPPRRRPCPCAHPPRPRWQHGDCSPAVTAPPTARRARAHFDPSHAGSRRAVTRPGPADAATRQQPPAAAVPGQITARLRNRPLAEPCRAGRPSRRPPLYSATEPPPSAPQNNPAAMTVRAGPHSPWQGGGVPAHPPRHHILPDI